MYLKFTVANVNDPARRQEVSFLVDTGATRAWVPKEVADAIGIEPVGSVPLELADGSITDRPYGFCLVTYDGETVAGNVVIGPPGSEPLVGVHVLQDFRLVVDLACHEVRRARAMRAKCWRQKGGRCPLSPFHNRHGFLFRKGCLKTFLSTPFSSR